MEQPDNIYKKLYAQGGDTWTLPDHFDVNPRSRAVLTARKQFNHSVSVLDIGCGKGMNSNWIAKLDKNSDWIGVDVVAQEGLKNDSNNSQFIVGDFLNDIFRNNHPQLNIQKDLIIDQGAVLVELEDINTLDSYLKLINSLLKKDGIFLALFLKGDHGVIQFPDGRKRVMWNPEDVKKEPFSKYFTIINSDNLYDAGYSFPSEHPGESKIKNPLRAKVGDKQQVTMFQVMFKRK